MCGQMTSCPPWLWKDEGPPATTVTEPAAGPRNDLLRSLRRRRPQRRPHRGDTGPGRDRAQEAWLRGQRRQAAGGRPDGLGGAAEVHEVLVVTAESRRVPG